MRYEDSPPIRVTGSNTAVDRGRLMPLSVWARRLRKELGVDRVVERTLRNWAAEDRPGFDRFPAVKLGAGPRAHWYAYEGDVARWLERRRRFLAESA